MSSTLDKKKKPVEHTAKARGNWKFINLGEHVKCHITNGTLLCMICESLLSGFGLDNSQVKNIHSSLRNLITTDALRRSRHRIFTSNSKNFACLGLKDAFQADPLIPPSNLRNILSNLGTRVLLCTAFVGFCHSGWSQNAQDPLPEPAPLTPDASLAPSLPPIVPSVLDQAPAPAETKPDSPTIRAPESTPTNLSPVRGFEPAQEDLQKWRFHLGLDTSVTYDDNIFIQPTQRQADVYFGVTPIVATGWGTFLADQGTVTGMPSRFPEIAEELGSGNAFFFRYAPQAVFFARHTDQNAFNENASVAGRWVSGKLTLQAEGRFQTLSAPNIDVGNRINSETTGGLLNLNYQVAQKTSLDSRFSLERDSYQGGLNSTSSVLSSMLNYQVLPKTMVGAGFGLGYTTVENGQDQYYEQGLIHLRYVPTYKITLDLIGGAEVREIQNGPNHATPVFDFTASYAPEDSTVVRLKVSRQISTSVLFDDQDIQATTVEASIRQRFFQKFYLTLSGGVQIDDYVDAGATASRTDTFSYVGIQSAVEVTKWLSMKAGYRFQNNDSSMSEFGFHRNIADFQFNLQF
jgi:hypothetical protein